MGFEVLGAPKGYGIHPGGSVTFTFQNQVQAFALGIWAFSMTYGANEDHWIQKFSLTLSPAQTIEAVVGNVVTAKVGGVLQDSSGHVLDAGDSLVYPVCIAVTGNSDPNTVLTTLPPVANNSSESVQLPASSGFTFMTPFLCGFDFAYSEGDNQVRSVEAGCGITYSGSVGSVTGTAMLTDGKGHIADTATVTPSVLGTIDQAPGIGVQEVTAQTGSPIAVPFPDMPPLSQAFVLIRSWNASFSDTHNLQTVAAGSFGPPSISGNTVTLPNLMANLSDTSGNTQDDSQSSVTAVVVALP